jgi:two-component system, cell cycle response regulator CpdR
MARILLVDDEPSVRAPLLRALQIDGHTVEEAVDGSDALDILSGSAIPFDMMISDIRMPIMDGIALTLSVAAEKPGFPIVLMTGYAEQRERARELEGLVEDVLTKPFALSDFRAAVRTVLVRRGLIPDS